MRSLEFSSFQRWKTEAKANGYRTKQITKSKFNTYHIAYTPWAGVIVGHFNTGEGPAGKRGAPEGELTV